jgi:hypothetical protein
MINIDLLKLKEHLRNKYKIEFVDFIDEEVKEEEVLVEELGLDKEQS